MARRVIALILILAVAAAALILAPLEFAAAQQRGAAPPRGQPQPTPLGGFFNLLFGNQPFYQPPPPPARVTRPPAGGGGGGGQQAAAPPPTVVAKDPQARKVVVIGDFVGSVVAAGLDREFAPEPRVRIVDRTNSDSGLARQDYYDWAKTAPAILATERPDIVVTVLGANDRQTLSGPGGPMFGVAEWDMAYGGRVAALAGGLATTGAPFLWVGTVPMRSTPEPDMAHVNDLTRPLVMAAGGTYVDVWDGFADDNGKLVFSGPDVDGQIRQLRTGNGLNFTDAGQAKLAFYVAREIRRVLGIGAPGNSVDLLASTNGASRTEIGPDGKARTVGPVISLGDPPPGTTPALAGDAQTLGATTAGASLLAAPKDAKSPQALLIQGVALPTVKGRADDFTWPSPTP